ncbi:helix-turn-helix domain-containing protein [Alteromonas gracilis]|uniref:helix-turn-helix domain-containing protein n=1 Tax=Alteromonas gracilis TaxID=1479524 RepID=UPI0030CCC3DF
MSSPKSENLYHGSRNKILGDFLRKHRERLKATVTGEASLLKNEPQLEKFTQAEVARFLGVKRSFINKIET